MFIIVDTTLTKPIGEPKPCAMAHREWADHDETNSMVEHQVEETESGIASHLKNSLSIVSREGETAGDLPKTCHLLPSTAILEPQNR